MTEQLPGSIENTSNIDIQQRFSAITRRELDAYSVATYADDALVDMIELIETLVGDEKNAAQEPSGIATERRALKDAGLDPYLIERTLDQIASVASSTERLDELVVRKKRTLPTVIVAPRGDAVPVVDDADGTGQKRSFEVKRVPKLNTLLLLLEQNYDIDLDSEEVTIEDGILLPSMMRKVSYDIVTVPSLDRIVLTCDQSGYASFVFDSQALKTLQFTVEQLIILEQPQLEALVQEHPGLGARFTFTKHYARAVNEALGAPLDALKGPEQAEKVQLLQPDTIVDTLPEGSCTVMELAEKLGISIKSINRRIEKQDKETFGPIVRLKQPNGGHGIRTFTPTQQRMLEVEVAKPDGIIHDHVPDGYVHATQMCQELQVTLTGLKSMIRTVGSAYGLEEWFQPPSNVDPVRIIAPQQQERLKAVHKNVVHEMPEGYVFEADFASELGLRSIDSLRDRISKIDAEKFGTILKFRRISASGSGRNILSPEQQQLLRIKPETTRTFDYDEVVSIIPDGAVTWEAMGQRLNLSIQGLKLRIDMFGSDTFGPIIRYREPGKGGVPTRLLTADQQTKLEEQALEMEAYREIPEGYSLVSAVRDELNLSGKALDRRIDKAQQKGDFGAMLRYRAPNKSQSERMLSDEQKSKVIEEHNQILAAKAKAALTAA